jgi:pimeloyl-ACP methyl ester carboxylesterase
MDRDHRVVCLHGLGRTAADWDALRGPLGAFGQVITPTIPSRPADALELLDEVVTPGSVVIGHSMGAVLATRLAARSPRSLSAVVLTGCFFPPSRNGRSTTETLFDYGAHRVAYIAGARRDRDRRAGRASVRPLASLLRQALRGDDLDEFALARVTSSVLVIHARDDHHVPVNFAVAGARRHPDWELRLLNDGGHHAHVSRPTTWAEAVCPWLAAARRPTPIGPAHA